MADRLVKIVEDLNTVDLSELYASMQTFRDSMKRAGEIPLFQYDPYTKQVKET